MLAGIRLALMRNLPDVDSVLQQRVEGVTSIARPMMLAAPCRKAMSFSEKSPSDVLSTSSTPNGAPSPCRMTLIARRMPCEASSSGVLKRSSFSSWFETTGRRSAGQNRMGIRDPRRWWRCRPRKEVPSLRCGSRDNQASRNIRCVRSVKYFLHNQRLHRVVAAKMLSQPQAKHLFWLHSRDVGRRQRHDERSGF